MIVLSFEEALVKVLSLEEALILSSLLRKHFVLLLFSFLRKDLVLSCGDLSFEFDLVKILPLKLILCYC